MNNERSRNDRVSALIGEYNTSKHKDNDERISSQYGHRILRRLNNYHDLPRGTELRYWKELDRNNRDYVTQEERMAYITQHPDYKK